MSRIGKLPIKITEGVEATLKEHQILVSGPKGSLSFNIPSEIKIKKEDDVLTVERRNDSKNAKSLHGLTRSLVANMVKGVKEGFKKELEIKGVGYRAQVAEGVLTMTLGFAHPVKFAPPEGIACRVLENKIIIEGSDKQLVGETAAKIRRLKPPEPYKGKGIKYVGEKIRQKAGKTAKAVGGGK
ncbi:50S ribosomal protein L6 [Candidatus Microgenomates bacterium]|nr:50S ribosomal protein L6 [Candidatus Microgenomates bacterium]